MDIKQSVWYFFGESSTQKLPNNYQKQSEVSNEQIRGQKYLVIESPVSVFLCVQYVCVRVGVVCWLVCGVAESGFFPRV